MLRWWDNHHPQCNEDQGKYRCKKWSKTAVKKWLQRWWEKKIQSIPPVALVPGPDFVQNVIPKFDENENDCFIISRHGGRRANSIFSFPADNPGKFAVNFPKLTRNNEWVRDSHHIIPPIGTSPTNSNITPGVVPVWANAADQDALLPLTVGGTKQLISFYQHLRDHNLLPANNYVYAHSSLVERTVQTSSLFWQIVMKSNGPLFTLDNSFTPPTQPFQVVTSSPFLCGDKLFGSTAIKQAFYGTQPPFPSPQCFNSFVGVNASNASNFRRENFDSGQSTNFIGGTIPNYETQVMEILNRLFPVTGFDSRDLQSSLQQLVLWVIMAYVDGRWINTQNLSVKEWIILNNYYFSNIYSFGNSMWAGNFSANFLADLNAWVNKSATYKGGMYQNGGNVVITGHENHQNALCTAIGLIHKYTNNQRAFPPAGMMLFVRNKSTNVVTAYSICPNPIGSKTHEYPSDICFHSLLSGAIQLNDAIAAAAAAFPPA